jgi:hypothetical protein
MSSSQKPKSARTQREAALYRRARVLTYEPVALDEAVQQEPRLLGAALMDRYMVRQALFRGRPELLPPKADWSRHCFQARTRCLLRREPDGLLRQTGGVGQARPTCCDGA